MCFTTIAMVTDHDAGVEGGDAVTHEEVLRVFATNVEQPHGRSCATPSARCPPHESDDDGHLPVPAQPRRARAALPAALMAAGVRAVAPRASPAEVGRPGRAARAASGPRPGAAASAGPGARRRARRPADGRSHGGGWPVAGGWRRWAPPCSSRAAVVTLRPCAALGSGAGAPTVVMVRRRRRRRRSSAPTTSRSCGRPAGSGRRPPSSYSRRRRAASPPPSRRARSSPPERLVGGDLLAGQPAGRWPSASPSLDAASVGCAARATASTSTPPAPATQAATDVVVLAVHDAEESPGSAPRRRHA